MSRNIRWDNCLLQNVLILVEALLELSEQQVDNSKPLLWVEWEEDKLRVTGYKTNSQTKGKRSRTVESGTKKEYLLQQIKDAGKNLQLSPKTKELDEIQYVLDCLKELGVREDEKSTKTHGYWKFSLKLKHQTATREENLKVVKDKWREHSKTNYQNTSQESPTTDNGIDWRNICREMLEKYKRLSTNQLLFDNEDNKKELEDIHVPLALVERKKTEKHKQDHKKTEKRKQDHISPEEGSRLYEPTYEEKQRFSPEEGSRLYEPTYEEKQRFKHKDFLLQVLQRGEGKTQGKRIALIGEPGAGKTTLLQAIAFWILENDLGFPIWVSLAELDGKSIKDYLLQVWLEDALAVVRVTGEQENAIATLFKENKVYLLLDGADEMSSPQPLQEISQQLTGFVKYGRVILSCRLNVWEANINALHDFETYRLLDFDYPQDVKQFINKWFANLTSQTNNLKNNRDNKAESLWDEIKKPDRSRIQDLVKNPLRLALLCATWQSSEGSLPQTKAGLYQQFVNEFYKWKENRFSITETEQEELNAALGRLAQRAIDGETSRFRLKHKLIREELGDPKKENSLFARALQLGWLNQVGIAAESSSKEEVYAFYHATFEEYFAALAIDDWDYFLPRTHDNNNPQPVRDKYRIVEPQWKEVILLWLGREDIEKSEKEDFINALVEFKDGCEHFKFYVFQTYFLAAAGIAQCVNIDICRKKEIVNQIVKYSFGYLNEKNQWIEFLEPISNQAKEVLQETEFTITIQKLIDIIKSCVGRKREKIHSQVVETIVKIAATKSTANKALENLRNSNLNKYTIRQLAKIQGRIDPENILAIHQLEKLIDLTQDKFERWILIDDLITIDSDNQKAITELWEILNSAEEESEIWRCVGTLSKISTANSEIVKHLEKLLRLSKNHYTLITVAESLGKISPGNPEAIKVTVPLIKSAKNKNQYDLRNQAAWCLVELGIENPELAIEELIKLIDSEKDEYVLFLAAYSLIKIDTNNLAAIEVLEKIIDLGEDKYTSCRAADILIENNPCHVQAIDKLKQIISSVKEEKIICLAANGLMKSENGKLEAIAHLKKIINSTINPLISRQATDILIRLMPEDKLGEIVSFGKKYLLDVFERQMHEQMYEQIYQQIYELIWYCAQNMTYPEFYQAWSREEQGEFSEII